MKKCGKKMCNNWHLGGSCDKGEFCNFQHEPKLPPGEVTALRYKARSLACKNRYCENIDCCTLETPPITGIRYCMRFRSSTLFENGH